MAGNEVGVGNRAGVRGGTFPVLFFAMIFLQVPPTYPPWAEDTGMAAAAARCPDCHGIEDTAVAAAADTRGASDTVCCAAAGVEEREAAPPSACSSATTELPSGGESCQGICVCMRDMEAFSLRRPTWPGLPQVV